MAIMVDTPTDALKAVPFFARLSSFQINELSHHLVARKFRADQIVFHLGDPAGLLYIITEGKVKISYASADGQEIVLAILGSGDFFGELALLDDSPRSATAEAIEETNTLTLHRVQFLSFLDNNPPFARHVLNVLARRIRNLNNQISDIFFLDLPARLARTLLLLGNKHGIEVEAGTVIDLALTQTDLGEMTGATRVSINKVLGRFRRDKWVKVEGRKMTILDAEALQRLIERSGG